MAKKSKLNKTLIKKKARFEKGVIVFLGFAAFFVGVKLLFPTFASSASWHPVSKSGIPSGVYARDIGTGGAGEFVVGSDGNVYRLNGSNWSRVGNARAEKIAVGPNSIWVVQTNGDLARWNGSYWASANLNHSGAIIDVAVNSDDSMYFTKADGVYRSSGSRVQSSHPSGGGGLAVRPGLLLWSTTDHHLYYYKFSGSGLPTGIFAYDTGAYDGNSEWAITTTPTNNGYTVDHLYAVGWRQEPYHVGANQISVDQHGNPWIITGPHNIYHWY